MGNRELGAKEGLLSGVNVSLLLFLSIASNRTLSKKFCSDEDAERARSDTSNVLATAAANVVGVMVGSVIC